MGLNCISEASGAPSASLEETSTSPLAQAVDEAISDIKNREDGFFKAIVETFGQAVLDGNPQQCADRMSRYLEELDSKQQSENKTRRLVMRLKPLISGLSMYTKAFEPAVQAAPAPAAIIFGGAQLLLQLSNRIATCFDRIVGIMERIGNLLECYEKWALAYRSSLPMQRLLVDSYKTIISFWHKAFKFLQRKASKTIVVGFFKPLDADWEKCQDRLLEDREKVQLLAQATESELSNDFRERKLRLEIGDWIKAKEDDMTVNSRSTLSNILKIQQQGTCAWLHQEPNYIAWFTTNSTQVAWCFAPPGAGKTVLSASLINHLQNEGLQTVFSFASFDDPNRRKPINLLRSMIRQLLALHKEIPDTVMDIYKSELNKYNAELDDPQTAAMVIKSLLWNIPRVHIVVDGLDEYEEHHWPLLHEKLRDVIGSTNCGIVKWFITSRNERTIRQLMQSLNTLPIRPPQDRVEQDIKVYLQHQLGQLGQCRQQIDRWTTESGGNFLWARLITEIMKGDGYTCDDEAEEALKRFPRGLTGCYARSLEQLSQRTTETEQELARRIFLILSTAKQPLHLSELTNCLATRRGARDHSDGRMPRLDMVKDLCGRYVALDYDTVGSESDPLLKFFHKSVYEFFREDPDSIGVPQAFHKYFVREEDAELEIGRVCLTYLNYDVYSGPIDLEAALDVKAPSEHAFLRYATTFWFQHLQFARPSQALYEEVCTFAQSSNFWNCVAIQSRVVPYLFSIYWEKDGYRIRLGGCDHTAHEAQKIDSYADTLPQWLDVYGQLGREIVRGMQEFVREWSSVLSTCPEAADECMASNISIQAFPLREKEQAKRVQRLTMKDIYALDTNNPAQKLSSKRQLLRKVQEALRSTGVLRPKEQEVKNHPPFAQSYSLTPERLECSLRWTISSGQDWWSWTLDPQSLALRRSRDGREHEDKAAVQLLSTLPESHDSMWIVTSTNIYPQTNGEEIIVHECSLELREKFDTADKNCDSGYGSLGSDDSSDESDYDTDSDYESDTEEESRLPASKSKANGDHVQEQCEGNNVPHDSVSRCLLIFKRDRPPVWSIFSFSLTQRYRFDPAIHPNGRIGVWSDSAGALKIADLDSGIIQAKVLPEPAGSQLNSACVSSKEFRFSPNGNLLYYLLCSISRIEGGMTCMLSLSTFEYSKKLADAQPLQHAFPPQEIEYSFLDSLHKLRTCPAILTQWTSEHVFVALPPLSYKPKLIRISLRQPTISAPTAETAVFQTLQTPIYFPTPTPDRNPKLAIVDHTKPAKDGRSRAKKQDLIILVLDSNDIKHDNEHDNEHDQDSRDIFTWTIGKKDGWRDWDASIDGTTPELERGESEYRRLRGTFVSEEQRFNVLVRSGLDWTKKAFLSCS